MSRPFIFGQISFKLFHFIRMFSFRFDIKKSAPPLFMDLDNFKHSTPVIATPYNQIREDSAGRVLVDYVNLSIIRSIYRYLKLLLVIYFPK